MDALIIKQKQRINNIRAQNFTDPNLTVGKLLQKQQINYP